MTAASSSPPSGRTGFLLGAGVVIGWQAVTVCLAWRHGPALQQLLGDLGVEPPALTRAFLATYRGWIVVPLVTAGLAIVLARRPAVVAERLVLVAGAAAGIALQAWLHQAWFGPLLDILAKIR